ncbi:uncharacterized protein EI90DRAFT_3154145 [Cantharellus anzutake]|uniref:uncharacterized protein n=1 Tax=Cantharellus anzutake TaxID=1750568 RepID=UPI0019048ED8|nr:uncharacterized protein EI90DRAFT_3154145 [Cantharellus anzutake]KAF8332841.1 hypothetical protein EI90DRAFT_3154145 [Cantharellus anzutake]
MSSHGSHFTSLASHLRVKHGELFDAQLFAVLLVGIVAYEKNIIIRTLEDDITRVCNAISHMLSAIFGLSNHRVNAHRRMPHTHRVRNEYTPLVNSLFLAPTFPTSEHFRRRSSASIARGRMVQPNTHSSPSSRARTLSNGNIVPHRVRILSNPISTSLHHGVSASADSFSASASTEPPLSESQDNVTQFVAGNQPLTSGSPPDRGRHMSIGVPRDSNTPSIPTSSAHHLPSFQDAHVSKPPVKSLDVVLLTKLERAGSSDHEALAEMLRTRNAILTPLYDEAEAEEIALQPGFFVVFVCGIGDGKSRPQLPPYLLDEFSFSSTIRLDPSFPVTRPGRPSSSPSVTPEEIVRLRNQCKDFSPVILEDSPRTFVSQHLRIYIQNLLSATRHHPSLQGTSISARCAQDLELFTRIARVIFGNEARGSELGQVSSSVRSEKLPHRTLDCTEKDVVRVFASVVGHRLTARRQTRGPLGSMVRTSVLPPQEYDLARQQVDDVQPKETVNGILAEILAGV